MKRARDGCSGFNLSCAPETTTTRVEEWNQLSQVERVKVLEQLHGVDSDVIEETPDLVALRLSQLNEEIIKLRRKYAYDRALFLNPSYVNDEDFRLMFLRAESFNPALAARRIVTFFEFKLALFGVDKLARSITLDDLDDASRNKVYMGKAQSLIIKDQGGRGVHMNRGKFGGTRDEIRCGFYAMMSLLEDVEVQRNGVVIILYNFSYEQSAEKDLSASFHAMNAFPVRMVGVHYCCITMPGPFDEPSSLAISRILSFLEFVIGRRGRLRFRVHTGTHLECQYALLSFGISIKNFPITTDGDLDFTNTKKFVQTRMLIEAERSKELNNRGTIVHPNAMDVLLGRGQPFQQHPGNIKLAETVKVRFHEYYETRQMGGKAELCKSIVDQIKEEGCRFLQRNDSSDEWLEASDDIARTKVGHSFRNIKGRQG